MGHFEIEACDNSALRISNAEMDRQCAAPKGELPFTGVGSAGHLLTCAGTSTPPSNLLCFCSGQRSQRIDIGATSIRSMSLSGHLAQLIARGMTLASRRS